MRRVLFDVTSTVLQKSLDAAVLRHKVLANNIANFNTPGFKTSDVSFEAELKSALETDQLERFTPRIFTNNDTVARIDGNNVDVDIEMAKSAENEIRYNTMLDILSRRYRLLQYTINEGRR